MLREVLNINHRKTFHLLIIIANVSILFIFGMHKLAFFLLVIHYILEFVFSQSLSRARNDLIKEQTKALIWQGKRIEELNNNLIDKKNIIKGLQL